jgi:hypothetical protein
MVPELSRPIRRLSRLAAWIALTHPPRRALAQCNRATQHEKKLSGSKCFSGPTSFRKSIGEQIMFLYQVVVVIAIVGLLLWLVNRYIPMQGQIKGILNGVVVIVLIIWLLGAFGLLAPIMQYRISH